MLVEIDLYRPVLHVAESNVVVHALLTAVGHMMLVVHLLYLDPTLAHAVENELPRRLEISFIKADILTSACSFDTHSSHSLRKISREPSGSRPVFISRNRQPAFRG